MGVAGCTTSGSGSGTANSSGHSQHESRGGQATPVPSTAKITYPIGPPVPTGLPVLYLRPGGGGKSCTSSAPCGSLGAALAAAHGDSVVVAAGGQYPNATGDSRLRATSGSSVHKITVQSAPGQTAVFGSTVVTVPGLTFSHVAFNGLLRLTQGPTTVDTVHMVGGLGIGEILVRGDHITIKNSLIEGGSAHDGINIADSPNRVHDIVVENNTVRDIGGDSGPFHEHPDCIQIYDAYNILIQRNNLFNCYNSALTFSPGAHRGIDHVVVLSNFLQGCLPNRGRCNPNGGSSMDLRVPVGAGMVIAHNTFGVGSVRMPFHATVSAPQNIVRYVSVTTPCATSFSDSLIGGYPKHACPDGVPGADPTTNSGNVVGMASFVDQPDGNLHLTAPAPRILAKPGAGGSAAADPLDIDGKPLPAGALGAAAPPS